MDFKGRGKSLSYDLRHASASAQLRPQSPEERAAAATSAANDLKRRAESVRDDVYAVRIAVEVADLAEWADAAQNAQNGLAHLRKLFELPPAVMRDPGDAQARTRLENAPRAQRRAAATARTAANIAGARVDGRVSAGGRRAPISSVVIPGTEPRNRRAWP